MATIIEFPRRTNATARLQDKLKDVAFQNELAIALGNEIARELKARLEKRHSPAQRLVNHPNQAGEPLNQAQSGARPDRRY